MEGFRHFIQHMKTLYTPALSEMLDRLVYKQILQQLKEKNVNLNEYQLLHMYQLADANRLSTFLE